MTTTYTKAWYNTNAEEACRMTEITDADIVAWADGEVTNSTDTFGTKGSDTDSDIFDTIDEISVKMGYFTLPIPVVNINYLYGTKPFLPKYLGMEMEDVEKIVYFKTGVVTAGNETAFTTGTILPVEETSKAKREGAECALGADAISYLLSQKNVKEAESIILHHVPVVPLAMRYFDKDTPMTIEYLYESLIGRCERYCRLKQLGAPQIILINERMMLQEAVDTLINNGARGIPVTVYNMVCESLQEMYLKINPFKTSPIQYPMKFLKEHEEELVNTNRKALEAWNAIHEHFKSLKSNPKFDWEIKDFVVAENDEDIEEIKRLEEKKESLWNDLADSLEDMFTLLICETYPEYTEYYDEMMKWARLSVTCCKGLEEGEDNIMEFYCEAAFGFIRNFIDKKVCFC